MFDMKETLPNHLSLAEAASLLGISKATLRNWDKAGKLSAIRHPINGYRLYSLNELRQIQSQLGLYGEETFASHAQQLDPRSIRLSISRLHNILRDNDSQSNIISRFDELTKLLFAKVIADKLQDDTCVTPFIDFEEPTNPQAIRDLYYHLALQYKELVPSRFSQIKCSDKTIIECVSALRTLNFASTQIDVKGLAYEEIIRNTFDKSDHQQFFTPPQIVEFIISICEPYIRGDICDPASGTGGFLSCIARRQLNYSSLTSIEIDERLAWISGINILLHSGKNINTVFLPDGGTLGKDSEKYLSSFDTIITNPPFGSDFTDSNILSTMKLGEGKSSRRRGILFIERCHSLLREEGTLAIILDEGVLNLSHATDVRHFITDNFDIKAVINLPDSAFMPYATVNTSILVLTKRISTDNNHAVFFAKAETIGRKPNGDDDIHYTKDGKNYLKSDLPVILENWHKYTNKGLNSETENIYIADISANNNSENNGHRIDFQYHHPSRISCKQLITKCPYSVKRMRDICTERNISIIPSKELPGIIIRYTGLANIESNSGYVEQIPTPANSLKSAVKIYEPGDIIFAKMRPNLRKVALIEFSEPGYVSSECSVFCVDKKIIDPLILSVLLRSDFVYGQIMHLVAGIGRPRISSRELNNIMVPIPPYDIQENIRQQYLNQQEKAKHLKLEAERLLELNQVALEFSMKNLVTSFVGDNK